MGVGGIFRARRTENREGVDGVWWAWTWAGSACPGQLASAAPYPGVLGAEPLKSPGAVDGQTDGHPGHFALEQAGWEMLLLPCLESTTCYSIYCMLPCASQGATPIAYIVA